MSQFIFVRSRSGRVRNQNKKLDSICKALAIELSRSTKYECFNIGEGYTGVVNPLSYHLKNKAAACFGILFEDSNNWDLPFSNKPDGNFAIIRTDKNHVEIVSDTAGSRTVWYYFDEEKFIASSSQRMIVMYLQSFEFNESVISWILSTGNMGPGNSWDSRIKKAHPDSSVFLNTEEWRVNEEYEHIECSPVDMSSSHWKKEMTRIHNDIHAYLCKTMTDTWALPLSGGYDSRSILIFLSHHKQDLSLLKAITWGTEDSLNYPNSDAVVAKKLAEHYNMPHTYYLTDDPETDIHGIFDKYFKLSEGRIDHFTGYLDGFKLWENLKNDGIDVILRGDTPFIPYPVYSDLSVRAMNGLTLCSDYSNLHDLAKRYNLPKQQIPVKFEQREGESLVSWYTRLRLNNDLQTVIASLTYLKLGYVEQISPLLSKKMIDLFMKLPEELKNQKAFYKKFVEDLSPSIEFARQDSVPLNRQVLEDSMYAEFLKNFLRSTDEGQPFSKKFIEEVTEGVQVRNNPPNNSSIKKMLKKLKVKTPAFVKRIIRSHIKPRSLNPNLLAFRVYMIIRMTQILREDAAKLDY